MARHATGLLALLLCSAIAGRAAAQLRVLEVPVATRASLDSLARLGFEVADVRRVAGQLRAIVVASPETETRLVRAGFRTAIPSASLAPTQVAEDTFHTFHSFDNPVTGIRATLEQWAAADTLIHVDSVGASFEGRPILVVKIGPAADAPGRPNVLFMATHHAREWISTAVAMKLIRWLADSGGAELATHDVWVLPVENPDGYQYTFTTERYWRKNRHPNAGGSFGVDPNRNYPAFWGVDDLGSSPWEYAETYRGTAPASEPETRAVMAFHAAHPPVVALSYHSYGGLVMYPWGFRAGELPPDLSRYQALAGTDLEPAVTDSVPESPHDHYHPGPGWNLYATNGEYTDWAYHTYGTIAFTTELTSGCCVQGLYYGFEFPDDSALVERVFRDNLPFARSLIAASGDLARAPGVSGLVPNVQRFSSLWPDSWLSLDAGAPRPLSLTVRTATGALATRGAQTDSLGRGVLRTDWRTDLHLDQVRALHAEGTNVVAELISLAGAEPLDKGWRGWARDSVSAPAGGKNSWFTSGTADTLTSPVTDLRNRTALWLQFWTKHSGSTFTPEQNGVVQFSGDSGRTWSTVAMIVGDGPSWYPVRVDLPQAAGRRGAQVRFISNQFTWWIDAVGFASDATAAFAQLAAAASAEVSENPVRSDQVVISWPATVSSARISVFTFTGERLYEATVAAPTNEYVWDLTVNGGARRVVNGGYIVVVDVDGNRYRRRLFVARPSP
ncbi:MAG TPA: M14 family zinc carboxypeptidase [Gemmatimonadales bacterium]|nr:M14 family zinc carboxypeptidase [Gemmatimonadales bacterium]